MWILTKQSAKLIEKLLKISPYGKFDRASELLVQNGIFAHHIKGNENGKGERM